MYDLFFEGVVAFVMVHKFLRPLFWENNPTDHVLSVYNEKLPHAIRFGAELERLRGDPLARKKFLGAAMVVDNTGDNIGMDLALSEFNLQIDEY